MVEKRKNQPDRRKKHEATTVLEIKVRNYIYDRLSNIAQKVGPKATVEDVAQAMIEWHVDENRQRRNELWLKNESQKPRY